MLEDSETEDSFLRSVARIDDVVRPSTSPPRCGDLIGGGRARRYRILQPLGSGIAGTVYLAFDERLGRSVAMKCLRADRVTFEMRRALFLREVQFGAMLQHPGIVLTLDCGWSGDLPYLVMEHVHGRSLRTILGRRNAMEPRSAVRTTIALAGALIHAHERGIIHCDVKPGNVMCLAGDSIKLIDFGSARWIGEPNVRGPSSITAGTPAYMAPEQWSTAPLDQRTDIWALGSILHQMLTGQPPYDVTSVAELRTRVMAPERVPCVKGRRPELPMGLAAIVATALAKDPERRFPSVAELRGRLQEVLPWLPVSEAAESTD